MRHRGSFITGLLFPTLFLVVAPLAWAQDQAEGPHQIGAFVGRVLPNNVTEEDEIFPLYGVRYSYPASRTGFYDFLASFGNGEGVKWQSLSVGARMDIPIETIIGHAGVGLDVVRYEADGNDAKQALGMHFVGGVMTLIGGNTLARFDMKLNSKPGTSLLFALGLVFNLDGGAPQ